MSTKVANTVTDPLIETAQTNSVQLTLNRINFYNKYFDKKIKLLWCRSVLGLNKDLLRAFLFFAKTLSSRFISFHVFPRSDVPNLPIASLSTFALNDSELNNDKLANSSH